MKAQRYLLLVIILSVIFGYFRVATANAAAAMTLFGTFEAMGITVDIAASDDPDLDMVANVTYRTGSQSYQAGFPLARISATRFVGSLFWLSPATSYDVRITFSDPDGGVLNGTTISDTQTTRAEINIPTPTKSYYVSPGGSGTSCTFEAPCTLPSGISLAQAGEAVILRGGIYYTGNINLPRSGSAGSPIILRSYAGENAIVDGSDPATFTWTFIGAGVYQTTINIANPSLVIANGERLLSYSSLSDVQTLKWGEPGFYANGTALYVHLDSDANPNLAQMAVSRYKEALVIERSHIYLVDLTFRHFGNNGGTGKAIYFNNASDNLVQGCTFGINDMGIGIKRLSHRNVIQDNYFFDDISDWLWDAFYSPDIDFGAGGITFYGDSTHGRGTVIRRNSFYNSFDGAGICPTTGGADSNETDFYNNTIRSMGDDGFEADGLCSNVRIWSNTISDALMPISLAPAQRGPVYVLRNLIYETRNNVGTSSYTGSPFKFNQGGHSGPIFIINNTADAVNPNNNGLYIKAPGTWDLIYSRNNIWSGTDYALNNYNTSQPIDFNYDNLWNAGLNDLVRWDSTRYATLSAFTAALGHEANGLNVNPGFADASNQDYSLLSDSQLIDAGIYIPGINDGFIGLAPDIGAFEFVLEGQHKHYLPLIVR